jgi:hypothetical protein
MQTLAAGLHVFGANRQHKKFVHPSLRKLTTASTLPFSIELHG